MKQPDSNPLRKELARSQQAGTHPDSDLLSAFAEGALLARERESVLEHLALCVQCREVLRIATDAAPELGIEAQPKALLRPVHPPLLGWLPWVAVAVAVLAVSSALLLHETKKQAGGPSSVESARTANRPTPQAPPAPAQLPPASEAKAESYERPSSLARSQTAPRNAEDSTHAPANSAPLPAARSQEHRAQAISPQAQVTNSSNSAVTRSPVSGAQRAESAGSRAERPAVGLEQYQANSEQTASAKAASPEAEAVEVQGGTAKQSGAAFSNEASAPMMRKAIPANAARPHWRINGLGQLERSIGDRAWKAVPMPDTSKLHVVSVLGSEVWAGGENSRLEHSSDNGVTWESISLPAKNGYNHALTHIRFQTTQEATIDAYDGTSWKTTDGGRTWK